MVRINIEPNPTQQKETLLIVSNSASVTDNHLCLIEFQGTVEINREAEDRLGKSVLGSEVGQLDWNLDSNTKPRIKVGNHLLEGEVVKLTKPLVYIYKKDMETKSYQAKAVFKFKLQFTNRPLNIVNV